MDKRIKNTKEPNIMHRVAKLTISPIDKNARREKYIISNIKFVVEAKKKRTAKSFSIETSKLLSHFPLHFLFLS